MNFRRFKTRFDFIVEAHELAGLLQVIDKPAEGEQFVARVCRRGKSAPLRGRCFTHFNTETQKRKGTERREMSLNAFPYVSVPLCLI